MKKYNIILSIVFISFLFPFIVDASTKNIGTNVSCTGIKFNPLLNVNFFWSPKNPKAGQTVRFVAVPSTKYAKQQIKTYSWNFGGGHPQSSCGARKTVSNTYYQSGYYTVELRGISKNLEYFNIFKTIYIK